MHVWEFLLDCDFIILYRYHVLVYYTVAPIGPTLVCALNIIIVIGLLNVIYSTLYGKPDMHV
jgi:hypothetical protein